MMNLFNIIFLISIVIYSYANEIDLKNSILKNLKKKYHLLSLKYHPDKQKYNTEISNILFNEITDIYTELHKYIISLNFNDEEELDNLINDYNSLVIENNKQIDFANNCEKEYHNLINDYNSLVIKNNNLIDDYNSLNNKYNYVNNKYLNILNRYNLRE